MNLYKQYLDKLNEKIVLDVNIGDTILIGRFKNKKTVVKSIGKDDHGMPTINGRPAVKFRYAKTNEETPSSNIAGYSSKNAFRKKEDEDDLEQYLIDDE